MMVDALFLGLSTGLYCVSSCFPLILPFAISEASGKGGSFRIMTSFLAGRLAGYIAVGFILSAAGAFSVSYMDPYTAALLKRVSYPAAGILMLATGLLLRTCPGSQEPVPGIFRSPDCSGNEPEPPGGADKRSRKSGEDKRIGAKSRICCPKFKDRRQALSFPNLKICRILNRFHKPKTNAMIIGLLTGFSLCPPFFAAAARVFGQQSTLSGGLYFFIFYLGTTVWFIPLYGAPLLKKYIKPLQLISRTAMVLIGSYYLVFMGILGSF